MANVVGNWEGGRVIETALGEASLLHTQARARSAVRGVHPRLDPEGALAHLERVTANSRVYDPSGAPRGPALTVGSMMDDYPSWCMDEKDSANWRYQKRRYLK